MKWLGIPLSTEEIPFLDIRSVTIVSEYHEAVVVKSVGSPAYYSYEVVMTVTGRREYTIIEYDSESSGDKEILAAICRVTRVQRPHLPRRSN